MPYFSKISKERLSTCDKKLQELFNEVIKVFDCTIVCGYRNKEDQERAFNDSKSKLHYPMSKHNHLPCYAVDVVPYFSDEPHLRWKDVESFLKLAYCIKTIANKLDIKVRWGADWNNNGIISDEKFIDMPHWELIK